ncbi:MAG: Kelch repeat-containing protein [Geminicoccaceae bacterium]
MSLEEAGPETAANPMITRRYLMALTFGLIVARRAAEVAAESLPGSWSKARPLPIPVQEIYPVAFEGQIILAGGIIEGRAGELRASDRTDIYQPADNSWIDGPKLPMALHHPGLVTTPDRVLAIGGFAVERGGFWQMQQSVFSLERDLTAWTRTQELPAPRAEFVAAFLGDRVVLVGGRTPRAGGRNADYGDHRDTTEVLVLDPETLSWERAAPASIARNSAAGAVLNGRLHVVGGRFGTARGIENLAIHEAYDPMTDRWDECAPMPKAQGGLAAAVWGGKLYAFGGEFFNKGGGVFAEVWRYDPQADQWDAMMPMPVPRHGLGAVALDDGIHVIGGATRAGASGRSARHAVFRP